jgi:hypothetical protein
MASSTVVGIYQTAQEASNAVGRLREAGISSDRISVAMRGEGSGTGTDPADSERNARAMGEEPLNTAAEGMIGGAATGAGIGAAIGLTAVGISLLIPGVGPILLAGPLAAGIAGAGIGAAPGTLLGALIGSGVPEDEAGSYARHLEHGHIIVTAHIDPAEEAPARAALAPVATPVG